ncbi:hypothetical protein Dimus_032580 [Dionaea muscipula]
MMNKDQESKFMRIIAMPIRILAKARDLYVNSMNHYADRACYGGATTMGGRPLPRSFSTNSRWSNEEDDLRELKVLFNSTSFRSNEEQNSSPTVGVTSLRGETAFQPLLEAEASPGVAPIGTVIEASPSLGVDVTANIDDAVVLHSPSDVLLPVDDVEAGLLRLERGMQCCYMEPRFVQDQFMRRCGLLLLLLHGGDVFGPMLFLLDRALFSGCCQFSSEVLRGVMGQLKLRPRKFDWDYLDAGLWLPCP